jgi:type IV pilus assembly protein PilC
MPVYVFQAKSVEGRSIKGQIDAASETEARIKLRAQRLIPVRMTLSGKKDYFSGFENFRSRVSSKDLQIFTRQFATLVNSGIPIVQSIEILAGATSNEYLASTLKKIKADIEAGKKLGDAIASHPRVFDRLYVNLMKAGEESGSLDVILERLAAYIEKAIKIKNKVSGALYYPGGILFVAGIVIYVILAFVIPKFEELFKSSGQEIPWLTAKVVELSHFVVDYWYLVFGTIFGSAYAFIVYYRSEKGRATCDSIFIRLPVIGPLIQKSAIARFTRTFSTMISCGVPILDGLDISARVVGNAVLENTFLKAKEVISQGKSIVVPLAQEPLVPDMMVQMVGVGEQTGALDTMLGKIADFYEEEVEYAVSAMTSMIEPIMMVFLGGIIAVLVIAMYLPIFNLASGFGGT